MPGIELDPTRLARLLEVGRALVAERDPDQVLKRALEAARQLTGARYAALGILDDDKRELSRFIAAGIGEEQRRRIGPPPRGYGILGELIRNPRPLRLAKISEHPRSYGFPTEHPPMQSFLGVPVSIRGEVCGNLYLTEKEGPEGAVEFDEQDERLIVVLADWVAVAVDNARAHAESLRRERELERVTRGLMVTASLNREVIAKADLPRVLELAVKRSRALARCHSTVLLLIDGDDFSVAAIAGDLDPDLVGSTLPMANTPALDVLRAGHGQVITGGALARFGRLAAHSRTCVAVPLRARGADLGALIAFDPLADGEMFSPDDVVSMESFASAVAIAVSASQQLEDERLSLSMWSTERERQRWARELHDETLQELGALNVMQESALQVDDAELMRRTLVNSNEQVSRIIGGLQSLITELRPAALDQLGVEAAVEALAERIRSRSGLDIELDVDLAYESGREPHRPAPELEATIYRTVQEALNNVVKHADATRARVSIEEHDGSVAITVEDDGRGFNGGGRDRVGFGLLGMRERIGLVGGDLDIQSVPGDGSRVRAELPIRRVEA